MLYLKKRFIYFLLFTLGVIITPIASAQVQQDCHTEGGLTICQPFIQAENCLPGEPNCDLEQDKPAQIEQTTTIQEESEDRRDPPLDEPGLEQAEMKNSVSSEEKIQTTFIKPSNASLAVGALALSLGIAVLSIKRIPLKRKSRFGIAGGLFVITGGALLAGGCSPSQISPIPHNRCEYLLVDKETFLPLDGGDDLVDEYQPEPLHSGAGLSEIAAPIPPVSDFEPPRDIRSEGESSESCMNRCISKELYLYKICDGEIPELVSKGTLNENQKANYCAAACGIESVLPFLEEAAVIS